MIIKIIELLSPDCTHSIMGHVPLLHGQNLLTIVWTIILLLEIKIQSIVKFKCQKNEKKAILMYLYGIVRIWM